LLALRDYLLKDYNLLGAGDLLLIIAGGRPVGRAGLVASVLAGLAFRENDRVFLHYRIVVPPTEDIAEARERFWNRFKRGYQQLSGAVLEDDQAAWFDSRVEIVPAPNLRTGSVIEILRAQTERTAVIVTEAALYRDEEVEPYIAPGAAGPLLSEDLWVPQLLALGNAAVPIAYDQHL